MKLPYWADECPEVILTEKVDGTDYKGPAFLRCHDNSCRTLHTVSMLKANQGCDVCRTNKFVAALRLRQSEVEWLMGMKNQLSDWERRLVNSTDPAEFGFEVQS